MGGSGSTHGSRKVSFELDEQEQVRVLQGIRLSEDVVNRMKEKSQPKQDQLSQEKPKVSTGICPPTTESLGQKPSEAKRNCIREQAMVQEELLQLAKREKEAVSESLNAALQQERIGAREDKQKASQLYNAEVVEHMNSCVSIFSFVVLKQISERTRKEDK
ncbi:putative MICOS complex subunit protein [Naja naja]|nr:putative MICOS complex subunit protein [Naja naja]